MSHERANRSWVRILDCQRYPGKLRYLVAYLVTPSMTPEQLGPMRSSQITKHKTGREVSDAILRFSPGYTIPSELFSSP